MTEPIKPMVLPEDWPEDSAHENGCYMNRCCVCSREFRGHKRRATCKACTVTEPIKLPPFKWEMYQYVPAGPAIRMIEDYARLAVEQNTAELKAEVDALKRRLGQHDACNGVMGESGYVPECISMRAEVERLREDAERWRAVRGWFRVMSPNIDGNHGWYPTGEWGRHRGITIDAVADAARAALKETK
jgi:hypothetical protein